LHRHSLLSTDYALKIFIIVEIKLVHLVPMLQSNMQSDMRKSQHEYLKLAAFIAT
jgi:hypothetical protein